MDDERWDDLVDMIDERFGPVKNEKTNTPRRDGSPEWHDAVVFERGGARMKLERVSRPRVLDVKTFYARKRGAGVREEVTYSETERTNSVRLYQWDGATWQEVDLSEISR